MALEEKQTLLPDGGERMTRLALCVVIGVAVVYATVKLCEGKNIPLWEKYGPWITANQVQAIAVLSAVLYGVSLALWPEGNPPAATPQDMGGYQPCT